MIRTMVLVAALLFAGCAIQQPSQPPHEAEARPLPFKGVLISGNPQSLPPVVAMSLVDQSNVEFMYREELTHEEHHPSQIMSSIDPLTYAGKPTGEYKVTAVASLSVFDHDRLLGEYTAQSNVTKSYGLFSQPTHREIDDEAKAAVRAEIDRKLNSDAWRLAETISGTE